MIILSAMVLALLGGVTLGGVSAASELKTADNVRYKYLQSPQMLAADNNFVYVIDGGNLVVFNKNILPLATSHTITLSGITPLHIDIDRERNQLFIFESNRMHVFNTANMTASPQVINFTTGKVAFHVTHGKIFYTDGASFGHSTFDGTTLDHQGWTPVNLLPGHQIRTITALVENDIVTVFTGSHHPTTNAGAIFINSTQILHSHNFLNIRSLNFVNGRLVFVSNNDLNYMLPVNHSAVHTVDTGNDPFSTMASHLPFFVFTISQNAVYVIDAKRSINMFQFNASNQLRFERTIAASHGSDQGFHLNPLALAVIDQYRYVIADEIGVKLIDMSATTQIQFITRDLTNIVDIVFNGWQRLYMTDSNDNVHLFEIVFNVPRTRVTAINQLDFDGDISDVPTIAWRHTNASGDAITSFNQNARTRDIDRVTGRIFYICQNNRHAVRVLDRPEYGWDYVGYDFENFNWQDTASRLEYHAFARNGLFRTTSRPTVLFRFPNAVQPRHQVAADTPLLILSDVRAFGNWSLVMFRGNEYYVFNHDTNGHLNAPDQANFSRRDLHDLEPAHAFSRNNIQYQRDSQGNFIYYNSQRVFVGFSSRVLVHNLVIYKFPIRDADNLRIGTINRNFMLPGPALEPGLVINRKINERCHCGRFFYEILVDANGNPARLRPNGTIDHDVYRYVGFVEQGYVNDSFSVTRLQAFIPNARTVIPRDIGGIRIFSYLDANGQGQGAFRIVTSYDEDESPFEMLRNNHRIRVVGPLVRGGFTQIVYYDGQNHPAFIETRFIVKDGITTWQIIAIIASITSVCVAAFVIVRHQRQRKRRLQLPELM